MPFLRQPSRFAVQVVTAGVIALGLSPFTGPNRAAAQEGTPKQLVVSLHVTDKKGVPFTDLEASELQVTENGKAREVQVAELDRRPLAVALVLDNNSELSTSFMQSVVPAGVAVVKALPPGTTIDIWTTGDRPGHVAESLTDPAAAEAAMKSIPAIGVNSLLHTIAEASKALPDDEEHRTAVIVMTSGSLGGEGYGQEQALKVTSMRPTYVGLELTVGHPDSRIENELDYLAKYTGGYFERVLAVTAFEKKAPALVALVNAQYRIAWQPAGNPRETKFEFKCKRKGAKVIAAQRLGAVW